MSSEPARLALYSRLGEVLGEEHAETLIQVLTMETASQLATKSDVQRVEARIERVEKQIAELAASIHGYYKTSLVTVVAAMTALTGIFSLIVGLIR